MNESDADKKTYTVRLKLLETKYKMLTEHIPQVLFGALSQQTSENLEYSKPAEFFCRISLKDVYLFQDGLPVKIEDLPKKQFYARAIVRPCYFFQDSYGLPMNQIRIRWECTHIYWLTRN